MQLNFRKKYHFKLKEEKNCIKIFCLIRKSYYVLSPEEWVRQHWLHHLVYDKNYTTSAIVVEHPIRLNEIRKRADIVVYKDQKPLMLIECKAPNIILSQLDIDQLTVYNTILQAKFLILSNGMNHCIFEKKDENVYPMKGLPASR